MDIQSMDKPSVLLELKRLAQKNLPIKGTYVKTLKQEDIFEQPVNKTTELHAVKLGKQQILVPIIKEEEITQGAISDDLVMKLLSKIKDKKSRQILSAYVEQEQQEAIKPIIIPRAEEDNVVETDEVVLLKEKKNEIVKTARTLKTLNELNEYLESEDIDEFKKELKDNKLSNTLAAFTRTINALKRRLETKGFVEMKKTEAEESKRKVKEDAEESKRKAKEEAEESKRKAKEEEEQKKRKAKEDAEESKRKAKEEDKQMNLQELRQEMAETAEKMKEELKSKDKGKDNKKLQEMADKLFSEMERKGAAKTKAQEKTKEEYRQKAKKLQEIMDMFFSEMEQKGAAKTKAQKETKEEGPLDKYGYHPSAYPKEIRNDEEAKAIFRDEMEKKSKIGQTKREANAKIRALQKETAKDREEKQLDLVDKFILEMEQKGAAKTEAQKSTASKSYKESREYIIGNVLKNKLKRSEALKKIDEMLKQTKQKDKAKAEEFIDKVINDAAKDLKEEEEQNIRKAKEEEDLKKRKAKEEADLKKREEEFVDEINKKLSRHQNIFLKKNTESLSELQSRKERLDKITEERVLELKQKIKEAKSGEQKREALKDFDKYIKYRRIDISKLPGDYYLKLEKEIEKEEEEERVKEVKRKLRNLKEKLKRSLSKTEEKKIREDIRNLEKE